MVARSGSASVSKETDQTRPRMTLAKTTQDVTRSSDKRQIHSPWASPGVVKAVLTRKSCSGFESCHRIGRRPKSTVVVTGQRTKRLISYWAD